MANDIYSDGASLRGAVSIGDKPNVGWHKGGDDGVVERSVALASGYFNNVKTDAQQQWGDGASLSFPPQGESHARWGETSLFAGAFYGAPSAGNNSLTPSPEVPMFTPSLSVPAIVPTTYETPQALRDALNLELQVLDLQSSLLTGRSITSLTALAATPASAETQALRTHLNAQLARWQTQGLSHGHLAGITDWTQLLDGDSRLQAVLNDHAAPQTPEHLQRYLETHVLRLQPDLKAQEATTLPAFAALTPTGARHELSADMNDELAALQQRWGKTLPGELFSITHWARLLPPDSAGRNAAVTAGYVEVETESDARAVLDASVATFSGNKVNSLDQLLSQPIDSEGRRTWWTNLQQQWQALKGLERLGDGVASLNVADALTPAQSRLALENGYRPAETREELQLLLNRHLPEITNNAKQDHLPDDLGQLIRDYDASQATKAVEAGLQQAFDELNDHGRLGEALKGESHWTAALDGRQYATAAERGYVPSVSSEVAERNRWQSNFEVAGQLPQLVRQPLLQALTQTGDHHPDTRQDAYQQLVDLSGKVQQQGQQTVGGGRQSGPSPGRPAPSKPGAMATDTAAD